MTPRWMAHWRPVCCSLALAAPLWGHASGPHEHGVVKLDIAVEPGRVTVLMASPLANLIGFEHAPRDAAERRRADAAIATLKAAGPLFRFDPASGCVPGAIELASAALKLGPAEADPAEAGHADIDASFTFDCRRGPLPPSIDVRLFDAFGGMQRLDVQLVDGKAQVKRTLVRPATRLTWSR